MEGRKAQLLPGDGVLIEFGSVVGAVQCAIGLQKLTTERNAGSPGDRRME
jgi:adenylate cyclase